MPQETKASKTTTEAAGTAATNPHEAKEATTMKITVRLKQNHVLNPTQRRGVITGHVVNVGGQEGDNIVKPGIRKMDEAKASARDFLFRNFGHLGRVDVEFEEQE